MRIISALIFLLSLNAQAESLSGVIKNHEGVSELKKNNMLEGQARFSEALRFDPLSSAIHLNLGLSFYGFAQPEKGQPVDQNMIAKAQGSYETALKFSHDPLTRFAALFNLGELMQKLQKKDEALAYYQQALELQPQSAEVKTNIELLMQDAQKKGGGEGQSQDQDKKEDQQKKDNPDGKGDKDQKEQDKDNKDNKDPEKKKGPYAKNKPQPKPFKSEELTQGDVNKILGEIKQQEGKIRADYYKKEVKEQPRDKDW